MLLLPLSPEFNPSLDVSPLDELESVDELEDLDVGIRLTVDDNYRIHREFFKNIGSRLTEDAEMFISEVGRPTMIEDLAKENGFKIVSWYDMTIKNLNLLHLKR